MAQKTTQLLLLLLLFSVYSPGIYAQISGKVFRDLPMNGTSLNVYGQEDGNELGVEGVTVTVYPGALTDVTDVNGDYSIAVANGEYRVEFSWPTMTWLQSSPDAQQENTSVRFVEVLGAPVTVDFGLHNPADYYDSVDPVVAAAIHSNGDGTGGSASSLAWPFWDYSDDQTIASEPTTSYANASDVGSLWGAAYQKETTTLFGAAVLRRHMGLGPLGIGGIYAVEDILGTPTLTQWLDVTTLGVNVGTDPRNSADPCNVLTSANNLPSYDVDAYTLVGRTGLGDIDITEDGKTLLVMDLENKQVLGIDIATKTMVAGYPIAIPSPGCNTVNDYRPWAIAVNQGEIYVGVVCSAESSQNTDDLVAHVMEYNGTTFTSIFSFDLDYSRGNAFAIGSTIDPAEWNPWDLGATFRGSTYTQPILTDIEFDINGDLILGFMDRNGLVTGNNNYDNSCTSTSIYEGRSGGDILRAGFTGAGWSLESNATVGSITTAGADSDPGSDAIHMDQGPGGGEYYWQDGFGLHTAHGTVMFQHMETALGGLGLLPGSGEVLSTVFDPINADSGGIAVFDNQTGAANRKRVIYPQEQYSSSSGVIPIHMGKSGGIGDVEFLTTAAPIEIGNLVWDDTDRDGVQDPDEAGIANIEVKLFDATGATELASAMTDGNGNYIFSNAQGTDSDSHKYGLTGLVPDQDYIIRIENAVGASLQTGLSGAPSPPMSGEGVNAMTNDNNGVANGSAVETTVMASQIPLSGANNHTFDFGFMACPPTRCATVTAIKN